jgi:hypothetical protein
VVDAELDGAAQDGSRCVSVTGRAEDARPRELHGAEPDALHVEISEIGHAFTVSYRPGEDKKSIDRGTRTTTFG